MRLFNTRLCPRPSDTVEGVTASAPSARRKIEVGARAIRIHGGCIHNTTSGGGSETRVTLSLYQSLGDETCDFIDSQTVALEASGSPGAAQASFAFDPPLEVNTEHTAFWWTAQNATSGDESYAIAFDVEDCTITSVGGA